MGGEPDDEKRDEFSRPFLRRDGEGGYKQGEMW